MALSKLFTNHPVKLHTATQQSGGAVNVQGITALALNNALRTQDFAADGAVYATFGSLVSGQPGARFTTVDLKTFLDECGTTGMLIDKDGTHPGVVLYLQKLALGGTRTPDATAEHVSHTFENGRLVPRILQLAHQQPATLSAEIFPFATSSVDPVAFNEAVALPTLTEAVSNMWSLGKVDLNGTELEGVSSVSIDFGIQVLVAGRDADVFPTYVAVARIRPRIRIRTNHVDFTSTLTEQGLAYSASEVIVYARHLSEGGTYVADGTSTHISFTLGQCRVEPQGISGDPKAMDVLITPWKDGSTDPITIDTTAAIA